MGITKIDPRAHLVRDNQHVHFLRRHLRDEDLLTFLNLDTNQWVLAYWVNRDKGIVDVISELGPNFESLTREFVASLERERKSYSADDLKRRLLNRDRRYQRHLVEEQEQANDEWDWAKRRVGDRARVPWMQEARMRPTSPTVAELV